MSTEGWHDEQFPVPVIRVKVSGLFIWPDNVKLNQSALAVLRRDGTNVVTAKNCSAISGHWVSPYDGVTTDVASNFDIVSHLPADWRFSPGRRFTGSPRPLERSEFPEELNGIDNSHSCRRGSRVREIGLTRRGKHLQMTLQGHSS